MPRLTLRFLGPPLIELDGEPIHLGRHKAVALLAYLALTCQPHSRDALATLLWPELDQGHARGQLRRTLSLLNRTLGNEWLFVDREMVEWVGKADAWIDVDAQREHLAVCAAHGHSSEQACPDCISLLEESVDLYRDGFLAGFTLPDAPAFDEWQFFEGEGLRDQVGDALQRLARWYGDQGEHDVAIVYARRWLSLDPLHEPAHRELMALYARSGQRAAALRQYGECERVLQGELDVPPSPETSALYKRIRDGQDLTGRRWESEGKPVRSAPSSLPVQLTPFVGREKELAELSALLDPSAEARLVTVAAPGGMGKTRLALEAASRQLDRYPDGVWFVPLTSVQSAEAIAPTVVQVLGVSFHGPDPPDQQLLRYLREKRMLLVLDNIEHLLGGVDLLVEILRTAPGVRLLVTSRVRLNVMGERLLMLPGMDYPESSPAGDLLRYDGIALFAQSAQRVQPGFDPDAEQLRHVARICQLAQGMPLAIMLAASWVPVLTPAEIAAEMEKSLDFLAADWRDEPERHHSMRAVFDATWGMLTEEERQVLARLSVFRGGFTRQAAQAVASADLRTLMSLTTKSLLQRDQSGRYEVHELLRQYAECKLEEAPEKKDETLDLHCKYYTKLLGGNRTDAWLELDNVRAAWRQAVLCARWPQIHECCINLWWIWEFQGWFHEEAALCEMAVDALRAEKPLGDVGVTLGMVLVGLGHASIRIGQRARGKHLFQEGLDLLRSLESWEEVAWGNRTAVAMGAVQDGAKAERLLQESLAIYQEMGDAPEAALVCFLLGSLALRHKAYHMAEQYCHRALESDDVRGVVLYCMGNIAYELGEYDKARRLYQESLILCQEVGYRIAVATIHNYLGNVALATGEYGEARAQHETALGMFREMNVYWGEALSGDRWGIVLSLSRLGDIALACGDKRGARQCYRHALEAALERTSIEPRLYTLLGPARLLAQEGEVERALKLVALARHHPASVEEIRDRADELLDRLRAELSPEVYAAAQESGRAHDLEATLRELVVELGPAKISDTMSGAGSLVHPDRMADRGRHGDA
jgi:predicted ATPase/DNA-binding SARP family transcriptional activator